MLFRDDVGANKGSPLWIIKSAERLGVETYQLFSVGDESYNWTAAIGAATLYMHAGWIAPKPTDFTAFFAKTPATVWMFLTHFLLPPSRFRFSLDLPESKVRVRCLFSANNDERLPATKPPSFNLIQTFNEERKIDVDVGGVPARDLLMVHALTSLYVEGLINRYSRFVVYPGHSPGTYNDSLGSYIHFLSTHVQGYERELVVRWQEAPDSSAWRVANKGQQVPFSFQTDTVCLHPDMKKNIKNKSVIVFDDFTTSGNGLEWARNLLLAGGARDVVLLTIGKFGRMRTDYGVYTPKAAGLIAPFEQRAYDTAQTFDRTIHPMADRPEASTLLVSLFDSMCKKQPHPIGQ